MKKIVIALGGNALMQKGQEETKQTIVKNIQKSVQQLTVLLDKYQVVLTFGNGPEVGLLLLQNEIAKSKIPQMPLDVLGAQTQGYLGYLLEQQIMKVTSKPVITLVTQVLVDKKDKAFSHPTKPIGPYYTKVQRDKLKKQFPLVEQTGKGWRRVVASPTPLRVLPSKTISNLMKDHIVIAVGGGGIPVIKEKNKYLGVEAVIDKDLASAELAKEIQADTLIILTDVSYVYINYKQVNQKELKKVTLKQLHSYLEQGHFEQGSMLPKVQAAINFLTLGGKQVIITSLNDISLALQGKKGTIITP